MMNKGGLTTPTDSFLAAVQRLDALFNSFYGDMSLHTCGLIVRKTVSILSAQAECTNVLEDVLTTFVRLKECFRLRQLRCAFAARRRESKERKKLKKFT